MRVVHTAEPGPECRRTGYRVSDIADNPIVFRLNHRCLRLTREGDSGAADDVIEAWELPTRLTFENVLLLRLPSA